MDQKEVENYLMEFQERALPTLIKRPLNIHSDRKINVIIGPRRAGKTSYLFQIMEDLISHGKKKEELIYLNFEGTRLFDVKFKELREIISLQKQLFKISADPVIFLDEPQNVVMWERAVRELHDEGYQIFISGSSSKLLSKEIATSLRGRSLSYLLLPFSFKEFLESKNINTSDKLSTDRITLIKTYLDEYLIFGGFPEVTLQKEEDTKIKILESYFDMTIFKDIVERHQIKDSNLIKWLIKTIASSYTKEISINKIYLSLKSQGRKISKDDLYSYASLITDSFFAFYLPKYSGSIRKREPLNKVYLCDNGFPKIVESSKDTGKKMENAVFLELTRNRKPGEELFFWKNVQKEEVDFVLKKGSIIQQLIQVTEDDQEIKEREARSLIKASQELKCQNLLIITKNKESDEEIEWFGTKRNIKCIPLWKWLLKNEKII